MSVLQANSLRWNLGAARTGWDWTGARVCACASMPLQESTWRRAVWRDRRTHG